MNLNVTNETDTLKSVVLGQPESIGKQPELNETYDAKSYETILHDNYPLEKDLIMEMSAFEQVLKRYNVQVLRPKVLTDCNQVFARDVAFVIDDKIIISNIIPDRVDEQEAYKSVFRCADFNKIFNLPEKAHVEGGDVVLYDNVIFIGVYTGPDYSKLKTARTNSYAVDFLKELFPGKILYPLELVKHDTDPYLGILHLDCTFMPVGRGNAILYKDGFIHSRDYEFLSDFFGKENIFEITREEMYRMNANIFSISRQVVVSEQHFERLNHHMEDVWGLTVERIPYSEVSKMGGLLRCSTLPLIRE